MKNLSCIARLIGCVLLVVGLVGVASIGPAVARTNHHRQAAPRHHLAHMKKPAQHRTPRRPVHHVMRAHRSAASPTTTAIVSVVTHTDAGFTPNRLAVPVGTTVTFTNAGSESVWAASNPHPTHTDYPGFDAQRPYSQGESYQFTFTRGGTFGYHNHLNPSQGGSIVVE